MPIRNTWGLFLLVGMCALGYAMKERHRGAVSSANSPESASPPHGSRMSVGPTIALPTVGLVRQVASSSAPDFPDRLLVCTFEADSVHARNVSVAYVSLNAGNAWYRVLEDANSDHVSETSCRAGGAGRAYFAASFAGPDQRQATGAGEMYRSFDSGLTWTRASRFPFIDWTALAVHPSSSSLESVYLFGNQMAGGIGDIGDGSWRQQRGLFLFSKDGSRFSEPKFLPDQWTAGNLGALPVSAIALPDGSVLVLYVRSPSGTEKPRLRLYRVKDQSWYFVSNVGIPDGFQGLNLGESQMAYDRDGLFSGRLYVAFPATRAGKPALALSSSNDLGKSWHTQVLFQGDQVSSSGHANGSFAGIAVNSRGILGIQWLSAQGCPIFAISIDGGSSLSDSAMLGHCGASGGSAEIPLQVAGRMIATNVLGPVDEISGTPDIPASGFMIYEAETILWGVQITADAAGRFHPFWVETRSDGNNVLMTAAVTVDALPQESLEAAHAKDVTENFQVRAREVRADPYRMTFSIDAIARNRVPKAVPYPSLIQVQSQYSDCGSLQYLNAEGTTRNGLPLFRIPANSNFPVLYPGDDTLPVHLEVRVEGCTATRIFESSATTKKSGQWFYPLSLRFQILQLQSQ